MRVKTITCHDVYNAGAKLQCFALMRWFERLGHSVEIIDYRPYYLTSAYKLFGVNNSKYRKNFILSLIYIVAHLPKKIKMLRQRKAYDKFSAQYLKYTSQRYTTLEELHMNPPVADLFVAGSDQIWNTLFPNGRDGAFYLDFVPQSDSYIKCSYAASFATPIIEKKFIPSVANMLSGLDFISVREQSGLRLLGECVVDGGVRVVDPVFLFTAQEWIEMLDIQAVDEEYILVYDFDRSPSVMEAAERLATVHSCKIYTIQSLSYSDKCLDNIDPIGFLCYIIGAKAIISNSFHATAFSLIFQKEFYVIPRNEDINTRMEDLLASVGLEDRVVRDGFSEVIDSKISWRDVSAKVSKDISDSTEYLRMVLSRTQK